MTRRTRATLVAGSALVVALGVGVGAAVASHRNPSPPVPDQLTTLVGSVLAPPRPVPLVDGRVHLVYEIQLVNALSRDVTVQRIDARDPDRHDAVVASLSGADLAPAVTLLGGVAGKTFHAGTAGVLDMDVSFPPGARVPSRLDHRITIAIDPVPTGPLQLATVYRTAPTTVLDDEPIEVAPPLQGEHWYDSGGCCPPTSYHRRTVLPINGGFHDSQRYAIDFIQLDGGGRVFSGPSNQLSSYAYVGTPIHAVADGVVVNMLDGEPNQTPGGFPELPIEKSDGNFVVMDIGGGHFAFYAHFEPGLRVRLGTRVRRGEVLGFLGNTGNSDAPHLHFHIMDSPSPLGSNSLPYVFTRFRGEGVVTNEDAMVQGAPATVDTSRLAGSYEELLPGDRQLLTLPTITAHR